MLRTQINSIVTNESFMIIPITLNIHGKLRFSCESIGK